jgi:hypothetical protein
MPVPRTRCISTKVTNAEYAALARAARGHTLSRWARAVLLTAAAAPPAEQVIVAELLALRTILVNLHFAVATGDTLTTDDMRRLIDRADQEKTRKAQERLASAAPLRDA